MTLNTTSLKKTKENIIDVAAQLASDMLLQTLERLCYIDQEENVQC